MVTENLKSNKRYLFYRAYLIIAIIAWNVLCLWFSQHQQAIAHLNRSFIPIFVVMPLAIFIPLMILISNIAIFPFKYGVLGPNIRTPFPQEQPIFVQRNTWGRIAYCGGRGFTFTMHIFSSGLGISLFGGSKVFIPKENLCTLGKAFIMGYKLTHNSPELRNPVTFSSTENFEKIKETFHL